MSLEVKNTSIEGLYLVRPRRFSDHRGYFSETFSRRDFASATGYDVEFVQDNESLSKSGVVRGLHFQVPPKPMGKLVRVVSGCIIDVAVDLRVGSPTYGKHFSIELSAENKTQLFIPRGFAHGFSVLSDSAIFTYKVDKSLISGVKIQVGSLLIDTSVSNRLKKIKQSMIEN